MGRSIRWSRLALAAVLATGLVACGDDDPSGPLAGDDLTAAEAEVMMEALAEAGGLAVTGFGGAQAAAPSRAPFGPVSVEETVDCPQGGSIALSGSISGDTADDGTGTVDYSFTQLHQACQSTAESAATVWTFDGDPDVTVDMEMTITESSFTMDGVQQGAVQWSSEGRSGTCGIDVTYTFSGSQSGASFSGSVSGTVCGHDVSESVSIDT